LIEIRVIFVIVEGIFLKNIPFRYSNSLFYGDVLILIMFRHEFARNEGTRVSVCLKFVSVFFQNFSIIFRVLWCKKQPLTYFFCADLPQLFDLLRDLMETKKSCTKNKSTRVVHFSFLAHSQKIQKTERRRKKGEALAKFLLKFNNSKPVFFKT